MDSQQGGAQQWGHANKQEVKYLCADCAAKNEIRPKEPIRCKECGHRIMFKMRTERIVQFEAR